MSDGEIDGVCLSSQRVVSHWLGIQDDEGAYGPFNEFGMRPSHLTMDNDDRGKTFDEIADIIESNPDGLWAEGTY